MFRVYWFTELPKCKDFEATEMIDALKFMEELRTQQREGDNVSHVTMSSENPSSVGKQGVAEVGPDYSWTKRRGNMPRAKK